MGSCKSCKAPILWSTSPAGARLPLDAAPLVRLQTVALPHSVVLYMIDELNPGEHGPQARSIGRGGDEPIEPVYVSHYTTCPDAGSFSRRG